MPPDINNSSNSHKPIIQPSDEFTNEMASQSTAPTRHISPSHTIEEEPTSHKPDKQISPNRKPIIFYVPIMAVLLVILTCFLVFSLRQSYMSYMVVRAYSSGLLSTAWGTNYKLFMLAMVIFTSIDIVLNIVMLLTKNKSRFINILKIYVIEWILGVIWEISNRPFAIVRL